MAEPRHRRAHRFLVSTAAAAGCLLLAACSSVSDTQTATADVRARDTSTSTSRPVPADTHADPEPDSEQAPAPARLSHRTVVARHLDTPWGLAFLPGGAVLVGERDTARVRLVRPGHGSRVVRHVRGVRPNGDQGGEAGLLGLALSPGFSNNGWVYAYFSAARDNRIVRMRWRDHRLGPQHLIFSGIPRSLHHNGGRIAFGPDGMLYATTGEAEVPSQAQQKRSLGGKILRMTPRGKPAAGNPFRRSVVYSYGHRNVEGLDWDPQGRLWATEFGDQTWDEVNLIRAGRNYGWPIVEGRGRGHRFTDPKTVWHTDKAGPSGIAIASPRRTFGFIGGLTGERLWRIRLDGNRIAGRKAFYTGQLGRIRTTAVARGRLWITTSNTDGRATPKRGDDKLLRIRIG